MNIKLGAINKNHMNIVCDWRNMQLEKLRTSYENTYEMQMQFYDYIHSDKGKSSCKFYSIYYNELFIGICGIENIEIANRRAEISYLVNPQYINYEIFETVIKKLIDKAFNYLGIEQIWGELYDCSNEYLCWIQFFKKNDIYKTRITNVKFYNGRYHSGTWYNIDKSRYIG